jgi:hypothetical protein
LVCACHVSQACIIVGIFIAAYIIKQPCLSSNLKNISSHVPQGWSCEFIAAVYLKVVLGKSWMWYENYSTMWLDYVGGCYGVSGIECKDLESGWNTFKVVNNRLCWLHPQTHFGMADTVCADVKLHASCTITPCTCFFKLSVTGGDSENAPTNI